MEIEENIMILLCLIRTWFDNRYFANSRQLTMVDGQLNQQVTTYCAERHTTRMTNAPKIAPYK